MHRIVDLTQPLVSGTTGVEVTPARTLAKDGWNASTLHLYSHTGTHMDAQVHFEAGLETIDMHSPARCMGRAWLADLTGITPGSLIQVSHLGDIPSHFQPGDSLLLHTGWSRFVADPEIYRNALPRVSDGLAGWCVERKVKLLGVEPPSVADVNNIPEVTRIHRTLLVGGVIIVEGLCNLEKLTGPKVFFAALPLRIAGGDGCPCRAFAIDGDESVDQLASILI